MRLIERVKSRLGSEEGYTMIAAVGAVALISVLSAAALSASNGDINLVQADLDHKRAHAAAQAGVADYSFHLNNDNSYWARCTEVPTPTAVNHVGSTANRRVVPGSKGAAEYAIELLPATGQAKCLTTNPLTSMLEKSGLNTGTFRIRSTGFVGDTEQSIVATYKRASLLDYIYFTQLETSDPAIYGTPSWLANAYTHCSKFIRDGRQNSSIPGASGRYCDKISFVTGDDIDGPLHTNDSLVINGTPSFGRNGGDVIEVSAPPKGWHACGELNPSSGCSSGNPTFLGPFVTTAPVLTPPATNGRLKTIAGPSYTYSCQTEIELEGNVMDIKRWDGEFNNVPFPTSGVIYVKNGTCPDKSGNTWPSCSTAYTPYTATYAEYPKGADCGTVKVYGEYSGELTIAAENDIIIWNDITREGQGLLGLIANNFIRVRHPFSDTDDNSPAQCSGGSNLSGTQTNLRIDAALLAISHSFIVDHYDCGAQLGELEVNGAISQKFRGAVGMTKSGEDSGYIKDYNYDDRLRYMEPPNFLDPVEPAWHIQRETLDFSG